MSVVRPFVVPVPRPICSHRWVDRSLPEFQRLPVSPVIGRGAHEMHPGRTYLCVNCRELLTVVLTKGGR